MLLKFPSVLLNEWFSRSDDHEWVSIYGPPYSEMYVFVLTEELIFTTVARHNRD